MLEEDLVEDPPAESTLPHRGTLLGILTNLHTKFETDPQLGLEGAAAQKAPQSMLKPGVILQGFLGMRKQASIRHRPIRRVKEWGNSGSD